MLYSWNRCAFYVSLGLATCASFAVSIPLSFQEAWCTSLFLPFTFQENSLRKNMFRLIVMSSDHDLEFFLASSLYLFTHPPHSQLKKGLISFLSHHPFLAPFPLLHNWYSQMRLPLCTVFVFVIFLFWEGWIS